MTTNAYKGITTDHDAAPKVDITVEGPVEDTVETVALHTRDAAVRAMNAVEEGDYPTEVDGCPIRVDWDSVVEDARDGDVDRPDVDEGDRVTYVRIYGGDLPAVVTNVRSDGHVDLRHPNDGDLREVKKVPPKHAGNESGFEPHEPTAEADA